MPPRPLSGKPDNQPTSPKERPPEAIFDRREATARPECPLIGGKRPEVRNHHGNVCKTGPIAAIQYKEIPGQQIM
jgi:hypothetical protein